MYSARFELAKYFQTTGDKWLVDHFFNSCLTVSSQVQGDGGKMLAQGHCNVGLAMEQNGKLIFIFWNYPHQLWVVTIAKYF